MSPEPEGPDHATGITVVMPTRGNVEVVTRAVEALRIARKNLPDSVGYELILVDDSDHADACALRDLCQDGPEERYLRGPRRVGAKRNLGARSGQYPYLVFIDSDCFASDAFLVAHLRALATTHTATGHPIGAVAGPTVMLGEPPNWTWRVADFSTIHNAPNLWPREHREVFWAATANLALRRTVFEEVGGFDEATFTVVGGEDVDLCMRLRELGYTIACAPEALVHHARMHVRRLSRIVGKLYTYGRSSVYNAARQPQHQQIHLNRATAVLAMLGSAALSSRPRRRLVQVGLGAAALWAADAALLSARRRRFAPGLAVSAVALEWAFDLGILAEALRRGQVSCAVKRFRYFDRNHFVR